MRKVVLDELTDDMVLAKSIYNNGNMIMAEGTGNLTKYIDRLLSYEIYSVYVEDVISDGIVIEDSVREETRSECRQLLRKCFKQMRDSGGLEYKELDEIVVTIMKDIIEYPDTVVCMSDIRTKDDATLVHSVNAAIYSLMMAKELGYKKRELMEIGKGALLHDIGKVMIDSDILLKNGKLTEDEFENMKGHTILGYEALGRIQGLSEDIRRIALEHHERLDGSGYPRAIKGKQIHRYAKIVAVADVFDALTAERCYRHSMSNYKAYMIMKSDVGIKYDTEVFESLIKNIAIYPNGLVVKLSDGTHGIVKKQNKTEQFKPVIRVIDDRDRLNIKLYDLDLSVRDDITIIN